MINRTPIIHNFTVNEDKEILDSIIHFLIYSDEELKRYNNFNEVPSLNNMVAVLEKCGHAMMSWYVEDLCNRLGRPKPWVDSPREFFGSTRAINYLRNLKELV